MFLKSAAFYDALYHFKDYDAASRSLRSLVQEVHPSASTLLDVGCGTGRHLEYLRRWYTVEGLDLNPELLAVAADRLPGVALHPGDMVDFSLGRKFDVVSCLFSALGYVRTRDRMYAAVARMVDHLNPGGVLLIEPWFFPESLWTGHITSNYVDLPDLKIAWMYTTEVKDGVSVLDIQYLVGTPARVEHLSERHELGVFTEEDYRDAIETTGLSVDFDPKGTFGRGLFRGVDRGRSLRGGGSSRTDALRPTGIPR